MPKFTFVDPSVVPTFIKWGQHYIKMATVNYLLKNPKAKRTTIICLLVDGRDFRLKISTGKRINPKHWTSYKKVHSAEPDAIAINQFLYGYKDQNNVVHDGFKTRLIRLYDQAKEKGINPTVEYFNKNLYPRINDSSSFWGYWEKFIETKKQVFTSATLKKFATIRNHLEEFENYFGTMELDEINEAKLEDLQTFFYSRHKYGDKKKPLNTQSTAKNIKTFKIFLSWCLKRKYTSNIDWRTFSPITQPDDLKIILEHHEIDKIRNIELNQDYLKNARDLLLLACLTGLRFSDFSRIKQEHLRENEDGFVLSLRQEKTQRDIDIPLTKEAIEIVQKLISGNIHGISNQKLNSYIKKVCEKAGINELVEKYTYRGRDRQVESVPKWELISTHIGRRTFCTNLLNQGVPAEVVMLFSGHRDYRSFSKYVNIPKRTKMDLVRRALENQSPLMKVS